MNILFISATYLPTINGVSYYQFHLAQALRHLGHKVHIYAPQHPKAKPDPYVIRYPTVSTHFPPDYPLGLPLFHLRQLDQLHLDLVHIHHPFTIAQCAIKLKRSRRLPFIFTHHTQYHQYLRTYFPYFSSLTKSYLDRHMCAVAKQAYQIISPTTAIYRDLSSLGITNVQIIPNGIFLGDFKPNPQKSSIPLSLIHVGRLEKEKNPLPLINLAVNLRKHKSNFHLTIVGDGKLAPNLQHLITQYDLTSRVTRTGRLDHKSIQGLLPSQHLFVSFSTSEVMPLTYIEALACGVPLALTDPGLIPGLCTPQNTLTISHYPEQAAAQILKLYQQPERLISLSQSAALSSKTYNINHSAKQVLQLYRQAVKYHQIS